jgi:D-serine deaminase-like pyridoxal phosphate-dependent protein
MKKCDLDTPCLLLDLGILEENLEKMQMSANGANKKLRPHAKTHKCSTLAKKQLEKGAVGVCVAKVSEAEALVNAGVHGVLVTGALAVEQKVKRLTALLPKSPSLMSVIDHPSNIDLLENSLVSCGQKMDVLVDLDIGLHRTGVSPNRGLELAELVLASDHLNLKGIQAYAGHVQHMHDYDNRKKASTESLRLAVGVFQQLQNKETHCTILSASGTGTSDIDLFVPELTELQVGSYALMDAEYMAIKTADSKDLSNRLRPALTLLTSVVNVSHDTHVTVDAGLKSLYRDGASPRVVTMEYSGLKYDWFGDEYGKLSREKRPGLLPQLGTALELVVSHCDPTVNQFDCFHIVRGDDVVDKWPIDLRGKSQ